MENIVLNMTDIDTIFIEGDVYYSCNRLSKTINDFIDQIGDGTTTIQQQVYAPIHGLTAEEMRILIKELDSDNFITLNPESGFQSALCATADFAMRYGKGNITEDLVKKIDGLDKLQAKEVEYRIYVWQGMKQILLEFFNQL